MAVHVTGSVTADPTTQVTNPTSPFSGPAIVTGKAIAVSIGQYVNNSPVTLKITNVVASNPVNAVINSAVANATTLPAGSGTNVIVNLTPTSVGSYSFDLDLTWST